MKFKLSLYLLFIICSFGIAQDTLVNMLTTRHIYPTATISDKDIQLLAYKNILQAIQGMVPGVNVRETHLGAVPVVNIRGIASVFGSNQPLYVVDGMPLYDNNLDFINPHDVEKIEVLKDPSSCAMYGARGGNGVVIITMKK
ncbi:MAG: TonB-dependent receptor plug domain-containing protein [Cytophagales bacterium]|nr:TonB-dependent receptor plug domain-containing protein [Cytophagales bacterium]